MGAIVPGRAGRATSAKVTLARHAGCKQTSAADRDGAVGDRPRIVVRPRKANEEVCDSMDTNRMTDRGTQTPRWTDFSNRYRSDWESRFHDRPWQEHEHAFRYGWDYGANSQFRDRDFDVMSGDMERGWSNRYNNWPDFTGGKVEQAWEDFKDTVREGWNAARREFNKAF
jgi:hypothetical protein